jgi:hypothetical protein
MGKRNKRYEEEERVVDCQVCAGLIPLEFYVSRGDMLYCDECGAEYIVSVCPEMSNFVQNQGLPKK